MRTACEHHARPAGADGTSRAGSPSTEAPVRSPVYADASTESRGGSATSRCRRASCWRRWPASAVQAFRRQGRRFGAGLVCSEMVSCVRPLARQRAHARLPADRPRRASAGDPDLRLGAADDGRGGADGGGRRRRHRRHQLRLPRAQGHEDRRRAQHLLEDPDARVPRSSRTVAGAVDVPVTVKMRRGVRNGSRTRSSSGRSSRGGAGVADAPPPLGQQMYTGTPTTRSLPSWSSSWTCR